ncbi:MAG: ABC transporter ATP-binding protein [Acidobacteriota bacterium]
MSDTSPTRASGSPLLDVRDLRVAFNTPDGVLDAVRGISFSVDRGKVLGIVGESGSGKSVATQTMVGLTRGARVSGEAVFEGKNLLAMSADELRAIRGRGIAMIFQNPLSSLHPLYRVGWQIVEMIQAHEAMTTQQARARAIELLGLVGIAKPDRRVDDYPHQFSGGMLQRAMIAMALALNPKLLVADEPTTALDVTVQAQILRLLRRVQQEFGMAVILITHDLGVIADVADDVVVMYAGRAMEVATRRELFRAPHNPYTRGLLASIPRADGNGARLTPIPGQPPSAIASPPGCPFHPRCADVIDRCRADVPRLTVVNGADPHLSACWSREEARS